MRFDDRVRMAENWNRCLSVAPTRWVSILHDDDELYPDAMHELTRAISVNPDCGLFFGLDDAIDEQGAVIVKKEQTNPIYSIITPLQYATINQFSACGFIIHRDYALSLNGYSSRLSMTPDWDLYARMCLHHGAIKINRVIGRYRTYTDMSRGTVALISTGHHIRDIARQQCYNLARLGYTRDKFLHHSKYGFMNWRREFYANMLGL